MEVRSKRHLRVRAPFDCEKGLPYTEVVTSQGRLENCAPIETIGRNVFPYFSNMNLHTLKIIRRFPKILEIVARRLNVPGSYSNNEEYSVEKIQVDSLIVGSGIAGLVSLDNTKNGFMITNSVYTDFFDDPLNLGSPILEKLKDIIKSNNERILVGDFLGKFNEGYLIRHSNKLILVTPKKLIFAVGARYLPPIFEGNDYPNVISRRLYLKRKSSYEKVIVLGSTDDAIKTGLVAKSKVLTPKSTKLFSRSFVERAESTGIEIEEVEHIKVRRTGKKLEVLWDKGSTIVDAVVFAPVKQPRLESIANSECGYKYYPNLGVYLPDHEMDGYMRSCGHFVVGGARGIWDEELSFLSGETPFNPDASSEINAKIKDTPLRNFYTRDFVAISSPYLYSNAGYACFCEDVLWKDVLMSQSMGYKDVEMVKRVAGIGLGECQGKVCTYVVGSILNSEKLITFRSPLLPL
ncbi:ferredoxin [Metallosphaera tengchongensis]|uniref:Ferredoxin n=1 Tax=Metallosphaera tengchongensis TaxID=1532350 RepID=A0A6N0NT97_9CREN|nr:ferredoxin [Metallosphaera tengchongensis]QKQ99975.1 ferredoxin [Metallosphaera tengchongensis]